MNITFIISVEMETQAWLKWNARVQNKNLMKLNFAATFLFQIEILNKRHTYNKRNIYYS